jgi:hypothetical protein
MFDFAPDAIAPIAPMVFDSNNPTAWDRSPTGVAGVETIPTFAHSFGRDLLARILPPLVAVTSVIAIWWSLYLIYPRLLPSPVSTVNEAIRLLSDGTFFFHMYQSLRRVFVGTTVAMFFSVAIGIYMGTVRMGEQFFQPLVVLGLTTASSSRKTTFFNPASALAYYRTSAISTRFGLSREFGRFA